jgi:hypothetical protein
MALNIVRVCVRAWTVSVICVSSLSTEEYPTWLLRKDCCIVVCLLLKVHVTRDDSGLGCPAISFGK